jgi:hypothetical protein
MKRERESIGRTHVEIHDDRVARAERFQEEKRREYSISLGGDNILGSRKESRPEKEKKQCEETGNRGESNRAHRRWWIL